MPLQRRRSRVVLLSTFLALLALVAVPLTAATAKNRGLGVITHGPIVDGDFGHKFFIDDGSGEITVFVNLGTNADVSGLAVGQLVEVTGFSSQFEDHYEIDIRGPEDLAQPVR